MRRIVYDEEGFPFEYRPESANFESENLGMLGHHHDDGYSFASLVLNRGSEATQAAKYQLEQLLSKFHGYVTDSSGKTHEAVKFTRDYAVLRIRETAPVDSRGSSGGRLVKYRFYYSDAGIALARNIICGEHCTPVVSAEFI